MSVPQCDWVTLGAVQTRRDGLMPLIEELQADHVDSVRIGMTTGGSWRIELRRGVERQLVFIDGDRAATERRPDALTEGPVRKGGINPPTSQVTDRPPPSGSMRPSK